MSFGGVIGIVVVIACTYSILEKHLPSAKKRNKQHQQKQQQQHADIIHTYPPIILRHVYLSQTMLDLFSCGVLFSIDGTYQRAYHHPLVLSLSRAYFTPVPPSRFLPRPTTKSYIAINKKKTKRNRNTCILIPRRCALD